MATRTNHARKTTPAKKTAPKPPAKKTTTRKTVPAAKPRKALPTRNKPFMTDAQGYATLAARICGILTPRINDWTDHGDGTCTRPLEDGTLHYNQDTRTLTWQATCLMGAVHTYRLDSPSTAAAARVEAANCRRLHADLAAIPALTADELADLGLLNTPTWARPNLLGDDITQTIPIPKDALNRATASAADTQPISRDDITAGLTARTADSETAKEHPQP
jgi:hypothetical protein